MKEEFVNYETALALKELGFDEPCFTHYLKSVLLNNISLNDTINSKFDDIRVSAPLKQQCLRWFREKYQNDISINTVYSKYNELSSKKYSGVIDNKGMFTNVGFYDTYEEAEDACIDKLIKIVKEQNNGK